jgi:hypothetical protein
VGVSRAAATAGRPRPAAPPILAWIAGDAVVTGALSATETGQDTAAITGTVEQPVTGELVGVETGADTASITGEVEVDAAAAPPPGGGSYVKPKRRRRKGELEPYLPPEERAKPATVATVATVATADPIEGPTSLERAAPRLVQPNLKGFDLEPSKGSTIPEPPPPSPEEQARIRSKLLGTPPTAIDPAAREAAARDAVRTAAREAVARAAQEEADLQAFTLILALAA